jgi:hypothetical protein
MFAATYSNFVNGETLGTSDLSGSPSLTTGATTNSPIGAYVITNSIGTLTSTNYSFVGFVNGTLTITPLAVNLTGTRGYDGTAIAQADILTITTNYDGTNLTLSGSAVLAGSGVGTQAITDFTGLTLGGTAATNYTLTNGTGSVIITNPYVPFSITSFTLQGTNLVAVFQSVPGVTYQILSTTNAAASLSTWTNDGPAVTATGTVTTNIIPVPGDAAKAYIIMN